MFLLFLDIIFYHYLIKSNKFFNIFIKKCKYKKNSNKKKKFLIKFL